MIYPEFQPKHETHRKPGKPAPHFVMLAADRETLKRYCATFRETGERYRIKRKQIRENNAYIEVWVLTVWRDQ